MVCMHTAPRKLGTQRKIHCCTLCTLSMHESERKCAHVVLHVVTCHCHHLHSPENLPARVLQRQAGIHSTYTYTQHSEAHIEQAYTPSQPTHQPHTRTHTTLSLHLNAPRGMVLSCMLHCMTLHNSLHCILDRRVVLAVCMHTFPRILETQSYIHCCTLCTPPCH